MWICQGCCEKWDDMYPVGIQEEMCTTLLGFSVPFSEAEEDRRLSPNEWETIMVNRHVLYTFFIREEATFFLLIS